MENSCQKNLERLLRGEATTFLDSACARSIQAVLKKRNFVYQAYSLFPDCEKVIFYQNHPPRLVFYKIDAPLTHQAVLGTLFAHQINPDMYSDIIVEEDAVYFAILEHLKPYFENFFHEVGKMPIELKETNVSIFQKLHYRYRDLTIIVPSCRVDVVVSRICGLSRTKVLQKIAAKEILIDCQTVTTGSQILKAPAILSIRSYGKYRFEGILKQTKKQQYVVLIKQYQ